MSYSEVCKHVALPVLALAGVAGFALVHRKDSAFSSLYSKILFISNKPDDVEDRISQLPMDVLISIVTRLSVTEAVRTSTLSKTWRNVYKFITYVKFDQVSMEDFWSGVPSTSDFNERLVAGVNAFLKHYSSDVKLLSFSLSYYYEKHNRHFLQEWMQSFNRLGVKKLEIKLSFLAGPGPLFSWHLLSGAPSLDFVRLGVFSLKRELQNEISYYSFKTIELYFCALSDGAVESILSCCPKLESLTLWRCYHSFKFCIHSAKLTFLCIALDKYGKVEYIEICAVNLRTFEYKDCEMRTLRFTSAPLLETLAISLYKGRISYDRSRVVGELIKYPLPQVKSFSYRTRGSSYYLESRIFKELNNPLLRNLKELYLTLTKPKFDLRKFATIFDACPLLQKFHLVTMEPSVLIVNGQEVEMTIGFHSVLEEVEFSGFSGTENEICFALHILKSAAILKRMRIRCSKYYEGQGHHGKWYWKNEKKSRFTEEKRRIVHQRLQGHALSDSAQLIILG